MSVTQPVEYVVSLSRNGEGQLTIPKRYRDDLGLDSGAPVAVLRIGDVLMLIPEQDRFKRLCESIASVFENRQITPANLIETLPAARADAFSPAGILM